MNVCKLIKKVNIWVRKTFVLVRKEIEILSAIRVDNSHRKCNKVTSLICSKSRMAVAIDKKKKKGKENKRTNKKRERMQELKILR